MGKAILIKDRAPGLVPKYRRRARRRSRRPLSRFVLQHLGGTLTCHIRPVRLWINSSSQAHTALQDGAWVESEAHVTAVLGRCPRPCHLVNEPTHDAAWKVALPPRILTPRTSIFWYVERRYLHKFSS